MPLAPGDACSVLSAAVGEPLAGTAVTDARWLLLERPGPWPSKVDADGPLAARCAEHGVRLAFLRRTARRAAPGPRVCFLASLGGERAGDGWVERHLLAHPGDESRLDLGALGAGRPVDPRARWHEPLLLACAHGERDPCCARRGRPLFRALRATRPDATWQTSHLGGHRFAATMLHLPSGTCLGRVPAARAREVADALDAGRVPVDLLRGRAGLPWAAQAAEVLVRQEHGLDRLDDVEVVAVRGDDVTFRLRGGEVLGVRVGREPLRRPRPASCGKAPEPAERPVLLSG